ncbi:MAG: hypothetical protein JO316_24205 [Abitibacteriaceae bacterium]|nr:hypothetical protein [Abditibacteriaceae bacterium]
MNKDNRTWLEKQHDHKQQLAVCHEQIIVLQQQIADLQERTSALEARIEAQKQKHNYRLFHWILNRQLKKLNRQREQVAHIVNQLTLLEQTQQRLEAEVEKPPTVRFRRVRVVYLPIEVICFSLLILLLGLMISQWLLRG